MASNEEGDVIFLVCTNPNSIEEPIAEDEIYISTAETSSWDLPTILSHRIVKVQSNRNRLIQHSSYFHSLLCGNFRKSCHGSISIQWNLEAFINILKFIYGCPLDVTPQNFIPLYEVFSHHSVVESDEEENGTRVRLWCDLGSLFPTKEVWGPYVLTKVSFFAWETIRKRILTMDQIRKVGWSLANLYRLFRSIEELSNHIFAAVWLEACGICYPLYLVFVGLSLISERANDFIPELCTMYLARNFMWAMSCNSYGNLPYNMLIACTRHPELTVDSEKHLSDALLVWLAANPELSERSSCLEDDCTDVLKQVT
ncbi:BTB/POZ domain-containing protein FBL11 [Vitis vinifera]|uniref:BTB/POZ domain-containing protein FBL11 n=1 Tax=Vitis vinifera TaxID=29760 RepID=A0A438EJT9_VITVI|nr:BTB/POZ domain-containing protein FBL11 [Vitis vinifera]